MAGPDWASTFETALEIGRLLDDASTTKLSGMSLPLLVAYGHSEFYHSSWVHLDITRVGTSYN